MSCASQISLLVVRLFQLVVTLVSAFALKRDHVEHCV